MHHVIAAIGDQRRDAADPGQAVIEPLETLVVTRDRLVQPFMNGHELHQKQIGIDEHGRPHRPQACQRRQGRQRKTRQRAEHHQNGRPGHMAHMPARNGQRCAVILRAAADGP